MVRRSGLRYVFSLDEFRQFMQQRGEDVDNVATRLLERPIQYIAPFQSALREFIRGLQIAKDDVLASNPEVICQPSCSIFKLILALPLFCLDRLRINLESRAPLVRIL